MKIEVEVNGFEIEIEEVDGKVQIKAEFNEEVIEELTLDPSEYEENSDEEEELKAFGDEETDEEIEEDVVKDEIEGEDEEILEESIRSFDDMFPSKK